jgi:hypothetical protein
LDFQDVISAFKGISLATKVERYGWKGGDFAAINLILTVPRFLGANLSVQHIGDVGRYDNE